MSAGYDGTITITDPSLMTELADMPDGYAGYVLQDDDAPAPDWDGIGYVFRIGYGSRDDACLVSGDAGDASPMAVETVRAAWQRFRDWDTVARYLRAFWDVVSFDYDSSADRGATIVACVTAAHVDAWGTTPDQTSRLAREALEPVRAWLEGDVYGVRVVNVDTGADRDLWDVYDWTVGRESLRGIALELAAEVL